MKILIIAYNQLQRDMKDKKVIALMILMPIILILILGTALNSTFTPKKLGKTKICYLNEDYGVISQQFSKFLDSDDIKSLLDVTEVKTKEEAIELINEGKSAALIYIESDFTNKVISQKNGTIEIYASKYANWRNSLVKGLVDGFVKTGNAVTVMMRNGEFSEASIFDKYTFERNQEAVVDMKISVDGKIPRAIDYYAVTMMVMTLMYGAIVGNYSVWNDITSNVYIRMKSAPVSPFESILGRILGTICATFSQAFIIILFTKYAYGVNWGNNLFIIFGTVLIMSCFTAALGICICSIVKEGGIAAAILSTIIPIFTFIGGGYIKLDNSGLMGTLSYISPNFLASKVIFSSIYGGMDRVAINCFIALCVISIISISGAIFAWRRNLN